MGNAVYRRERSAVSAEIGARTPSRSVLRPGVPPPPDYYRNNLLRVLDHVFHYHADLLSAAEMEFVVAVRKAGRDAQRLYARLIARKGPHIRYDRLNYREIDDCSRALDELTQAGLVESNGEAPTDTLLKLFTHRELATLFESSGSTKTALIEGIINGHSREALRARLRHQSAWLRIVHTDCLDLVQLLFFGGSTLGGAHGGLTVFVLEDLGAARFENYTVSRDYRLFDTREALCRYRWLRELTELCRQTDEHPGLAGAVAAALCRVAPPATRWERRLCDRAFNRLGRWFERRGYDREALDCFARSGTHPARERRVRILCRLGRRAAARTLLDEIAQAPQSVEEKDFAERFGKKSPGQTPPTTTVSVHLLDEKMRCAEAVSIDSGTGLAHSATSTAAGPDRGNAHSNEANEGASDIAQHEQHRFVRANTARSGSTDKIEQLALRWLTASDGEGWHLENQLPLGLAGLAFWDLVFASVPGAFLNPYQAGPLDLFWEDFTEQRREELTRLTTDLQDPGHFRDVLRSNLAKKHGVVNHLVSWRHWDGYLLDRVLATVPHHILYPLVCHVIENLRKTRAGFPDLLVLYGTGDYEFVEVKGPTDRLQPAQRAWFDYFREHGCRARVLKFKAVHG